VVNAILSQQSGSLDGWQQQQTDLSSQAGLLAGINNNLTSLATAVTTLADINGPLASLSAASSQAAILTASAQTSALPGTHQIVVSSLATTGTLYTTSSLTDGNTPFAAGDIQLQIGGAGGVTRDIPVTAGSNDTLNKLASYINTQKWGVTASVVSDAGGARLALNSQSTGASGALAITANSTGLAFHAPLGGTNASLSIDGIPFSSSSNTVTGAIPGVTLNLASAAPDTPVQITVAPDANQVASAITNFVTAYNAVIGNLNAQFSVDPTTNSEGPLGADSSLRSLQSSLLNDVTYSISGNSGLVNLASLGINLNNDGTLTIDNTKLNDAFTNNPGSFQSFFQNASATGFANSFSRDLNNLTDPTQGVVNLDIAENTTQQKTLTTQINNLHDRLVVQQQQLTAVYARVNATLEAYPSLLLGVTAELNALNGNFSTTPNAVNTTPTAGSAAGG
jgi:flagellar hook-associated protein 2